MNLKVYCCICGFNFIITDENDNDIACPKCNNTDFMLVK